MYRESAHALGWTWVRYKTLDNAENGRGWLCQQSLHARRFALQVHRLMSGMGGGEHENHEHRNFESIL